MKLKKQILETSFHYGLSREEIGPGVSQCLEVECLAYFAFCSLHRFLTGAGPGVTNAERRSHQAMRDRPWMNGAEWISSLLVRGEMPNLAE